MRTWTCLLLAALSCNDDKAQQDHDQVIAASAAALQADKDKAIASAAASQAAAKALADEKAAKSSVGTRPSVPTCNNTRTRTSKQAASRKRRQASCATKRRLRR